jgi:hypothetical protein
MGQQSSNLEIRRLAMATSLLLISGIEFLAAQSQIGAESNPCGERT